MGSFPFEPPGNAVTLQPSNDSSGVTDAKAINEIIANGGFVQLAQAPLNDIPFIVNSPLLPADGSGILGAQPWSSSLNDNYGPAGGGQSGGTTIFAVNFSGAAIIDMTNPTGTEFTGVSLVNFCIEGFATGGSGCHGILINGAWGAGIIDGVCVHRPDQDCLHFEGNATSGDGPDEWLVTRTKLSAARNGYGVWADNTPDSVFTNVNSSENNLDGWFLNWSRNVSLTACKGENNGGAGFHLPGQADAVSAMTLTACTTHLNDFDGFLFDNPNANTSGLYQLANCTAVSDGQAGGTVYAGYRANGSPACIMATGCVATGAAYGAYEGGGSFGMSFTGSRLLGTTANTHDDGTNTHVLVNQSPVPF